MKITLSYEVEVPDRFTIESRTAGGDLIILDFEKGDGLYKVKRNGKPCVPSATFKQAAEIICFAESAILNHGNERITGLYTGKTAEENSYEKRFGKAE